VQPAGGFSQIHVIGMQRKGAMRPRHKAEKTKFTSAGSEITSAKPCFPIREPWVFKTFAPLRLGAFALNLWRVNPV
jgi:hypothetical protein